MVDSEEPVQDSLQVHDVGHGVPDTGCARGVVGDNTLEQHLEVCRKRGLSIRELPHDEPFWFRFGNGQCLKSIRRVEVECRVGGKKVKLRTHVVKGNTPLLLSKGMMKQLGAVLDLGKDSMALQKLDITIPLDRSKSGNYQVNLCDPDPQDVDRSDALILSDLEDFQ